MFPFLCFFSNNTHAGSELISGLTVVTQPEVVFQKGSRGLLPCSLDGDRNIAFIHWYKGVTFQGYLFQYEYRDGALTKLYSGDESGDYDMNENFSLVIDPVRVVDNDRFTCEIVVEGILDPFQNSTNVYCL